jgi:hypothetical protein
MTGFGARALPGVDWSFPMRAAGCGADATRVLVFLLAGYFPPGRA